LSINLLRYDVAELYFLIMSLNGAFVDSGCVTCALKILKNFFFSIDKVDILVYNVYRLDR